jgi:hypothetical protein
MSTNTHLLSRYLTTKKLTTNKRSHAASVVFLYKGKFCAANRLQNITPEEGKVYFLRAMS